jgi:hypothetical protein
MADTVDFEVDYEVFRTLARRMNVMSTKVADRMGDNARSMQRLNDAIKVGMVSYTHLAGLVESTDKLQKAFEQSHEAYLDMLHLLNEGLDNAD